MAQRLAVIVNPRGGYNARRGIDRTIAAAKKFAIAYECADTPAEIEAALRRLADSAPEILAISGGDGTVNLVITLLREKKIFAQEPKLALLRGGTTNMIARNFGIRGAPHRALGKLAAGKNLMEIGRAPLAIRQGNKISYGFFAGTGAIPRAILQTRSTLHAHGLSGACGETLAAMQILWRLKTERDLSGDAILSPAPFGLEADGSQIGGQDNIFTAFTVMPRLIPGVRAPDMPGRIGILYMNGDRKLTRTGAASLAFDTGAAWVLDGEMQPSGKAEISLAKQVIFLSDGKR